MRQKMNLVMITALCILFASCSSSNQRAKLEKGFETPPDSTKLQLYWYWMNEHVSKEGITKDLEAMLKVGIGEAFIGNIFEGGVPGNVETMSEEWKECMRHAIREGSRLGVDISLFNGPGWSQSGGPWVTPEQSMRYLTHSTLSIQGGRMVKAYLPKPKEQFQDVTLLAYPQKSEQCIHQPLVQTIPSNSQTNLLFDGKLDTKSVFKTKAHDSICINLSSAQPFTARSLMIYPTGIAFNTVCNLQIKDGKEYKTIKKLFFDRSNTSLQLGPTPDGPLVMTFPDVTSNDFRIVLTDLPANFELSEIKLSSVAKIEKVTEKLLNKLPNTSNPAWNAYMWDEKAISDQKEFTSAHEVIDITSYLKNDTLNWNAPEGEWNIVRIGMTPTGTTNTPAAPKARGLEIDKMSRKASQAHFDAFVGDIMKGLSKEELKSLKRIIVDSYEVGPQNWTDQFREVFITSMGYDPIPWLPVLTGDVIGSEEQSNRFLWDMRRVIANQVAEQYVGGLKEIANKNNLTLWLENYGHWGYPSEFLYYGSFSDNVGGEFWSGSGPSSECKLAASSCHIYGKNKVYAESFTAGGRYFMWNPNEIKKKGDWSYTQGVNQVVLHVYIHQPYEDKVPGVNAWFGIEFNRHNTWFEQSKAWIDYQRRCCFMLQQGIPVNDVCIFIGEDAPTMEGWVDKELAAGYSYDFINADVIENRLSVKDGRLTLPGGISYAAMALPPINTMRPKLLAKIKSLVEAGAVVVGTPPSYSPSLSDYPACDDAVQKLATELWGKSDIEPQEKIERSIGKGKIYANIPINEVLQKQQVSEDIFSNEKTLGWTHRKLGKGDIYFLTNQGQTDIRTDVTFRVANMQPELWDAVAGSNRKLTSFAHTDRSTIVPISLSAGESCFIVFLDESKQTENALDLAANYPKADTLMQIKGSWDIHFSNPALKQDFTVTTNALSDWSQSGDERVKYFSGTATYTTRFTLPEIKKDKSLSLLLDKIQVIGSVRINDKEVATLWTPPYQLDITPYVTAGENKLEISVANLWVNQLIHQASKPEGARDSWTLINACNPDQPLLPSGLMGNATILEHLKSPTGQPPKTKK